jgi:hypothetical protein
MWAPIVPPSTRDATLTRIFTIVYTYTAALALHPGHAFGNGVAEHEREGFCGMRAVSLSPPEDVLSSGGIRVFEG